MGQLKVELKWLKKNLTSLLDKIKRQSIEPSHQKLSIAKQCQLLEINRSGVYYYLKPVPEFDLMLMKKIDKIYT
jgi:putative transposase